MIRIAVHPIILNNRIDSALQSESSTANTVHFWKQLGTESVQLCVIYIPLADKKVEPLSRFYCHFGYTCHKTIYLIRF